VVAQLMLYMRTVRSIGLGTEASACPLHRKLKSRIQISGRVIMIVHASVVCQRRGQKIHSSKLGYGYIGSMPRVWDLRFASEFGRKQVCEFHFQGKANLVYVVRLY
jgi:hypothetical protein